MVKTMFVARTMVATGLTLGLCAASAAEPIGSFARIDGVAVVSKGAQYVKAREGMPLNEGDRLLVMEGGSAIIAFTDGCQYKVADNEILTIGATSTCASNAVGSYKVDPYSAVSKAPGAASQLFQTAAAVGGAGATTAADYAVPAAIIGGLVILAATLDAGGDNGGDNNEVRPRPSP